MVTIHLSSEGWIALSVIWIIPLVAGLAILASFRTRVHAILSIAWLLCALVQPLGTWILLNSSDRFGLSQAHQYAQEFFLYSGLALWIASGSMFVFRKKPLGLLPTSQPFSPPVIIHPARREITVGSHPQVRTTAGISCARGPVAEVPNEVSSHPSPLFSSMDRPRLSARV